MAYYESWNNRRNEWLRSQLGPEPAAGVYGSGEYAGDVISAPDPGWADYQRKAAELMAGDGFTQYATKTWGEDAAAQAADAFQSHSSKIARVNKIGKTLALTTIGAVAGGAALTAAGVIGGGAAAVPAAAEAGASALPLFDTGAGGLFGSQAAVESALTAAGGGIAAPSLAGAGAAAAGAGSLLSTLGGVGGLLNAGLGIAGAVTAAKAAKDQAEADQATALYNAQEAEAAAQNALLRGEESARDLRRKGSLIEGMQRATFASRGLDLGVGSPKQAVEQTDFFTQQDIATTRSNAATEAATYRRQGTRFQTAAGNINPGRTGGLSLVGGLATVASKWYDRYGEFKP